MPIEWTPIIYLLISFVLTLPIAIDRERNSRVMGIRTYPLVAVGACAYMLLGAQLAGADNSAELARIMQGLLGGIGFLGGGAILKTDDRVKGTASAACIWIVGAMGVACALGEFAIAVLLTLMATLVLYLFGRVKQEIDGDNLESKSGSGRE